MVVVFTQKTAYDMRIRDWISDVCSSDLQQQRPEIADEAGFHRRRMGERGEVEGVIAEQPANAGEPDRPGLAQAREGGAALYRPPGQHHDEGDQYGRTWWRESVDHIVRIARLGEDITNKKTCKINN